MSQNIKELYQDSSGDGDWVSVDFSGECFLEADIPPADGAIITYKYRLAGREEKDVHDSSGILSHSVGDSGSSFMLPPGCEMKVIRGGTGSGDVSVTIRKF